MCETERHLKRAERPLDHDVIVLFQEHIKQALGDGAGEFSCFRNGGGTERAADCLVLGMIVSVGVRIDKERIGMRVLEPYADDALSGARLTAEEKCLGMCGRRM